MSWAECTSQFSMKALVKHGGKVESEIDYASWEMPGGCCSKPSYPLKGKVKEPHDKMSLVVFRFKTD